MNKEIEDAETVTLPVTLKLDMREFTKQRAAVLAANPDGGDALEGVLNLLDFISDEAEDAGLLTNDNRTRWWREGCIEHGLGDPGDPARDDGTGVK